MKINGLGKNYLLNSALKDLKKKFSSEDFYEICPIGDHELAFLLL